MHLNATFDVETYVDHMQFKQVFLLLSYGVATVYGSLEFLMLHHMFAFGLFTAPLHTL